MRLIYIVFLLIVTLITIPGNAEPLTGPEISFSSKEMSRGDVILVNIKADAGKTPHVTWIKKEIPLVFNQAKKLWQGFIAADLNQKSGSYEALVRLTSTGTEEQFNIQVTDKDYGVRNLTLPAGKVDLDAESLKRVNQETATLNAIWSAPESAPAWKGIFLMPVDGEMIGPFGQRSVINNMERSPHTGVDLKGNAGEPIKAINNGKVVLTADHFFTGNSVFVDHGGGIISMYFHMDKILVKNGDTVEKGQTIGLVGATGRVTGPHLHWGMRVNGAKVNPLTLINVSKGLEE